MTLSCIWGAITGPWGGILVAVAQEERQFLVRWPLYTPFYGGIVTEVFAHKKKLNY